MSDRFGEFDGVNGQTASEAAQARTDVKNDEIRRPGIKIEVISDEQWDKWVEEARQRRISRQRAEDDKRIRELLAAERQKEIEEQIKRYEDRLARDIDRDSRHYVFYLEFFKLYHQPENEGEFSDTTWKETYRRMACFLVKLDAVYDRCGNYKSHLYLRLLNRYFATEENLKYFEGLATRKQKGSTKRLPYSDVLSIALDENLKEIRAYLPVSKKLTHPPNENLIHAIPAIAHLVKDNKPKDLPAFKALMISGLDCKKHPKPPNMCWELEEALNQKIESFDEVKLLKNLAGHPELLPDYASLCARKELLEAITGSESIRILFEDVALIE